MSRPPRVGRSGSTRAYGAARALLLRAAQGLPPALRGSALVLAASVALAAPQAGPGGFSLEVTVVGAGTVSGGGLSCGSTCTIVATGEVTLTASARSGSYPVNWTGDCLGLAQGDTCTLLMDGDKKVTAWFAEAGGGVAVLMRGDGAGRIRSTPPGIDCVSGTCSWSFPPSVTEVALRVEPAPGSTFGGWSGACAGTGDCILPLGGALPHAVSALLYTRIPSLEIRRNTGPITGSVTSDLPGIDCPGPTMADCREDYPQGARVTLTAVPRVGLPGGPPRALGVVWDARCEVIDERQCVLTVDRPMVIDVWFVPLNDVDPPLNVTVVGRGRVTSEPAGIDCGLVCSHRFRGDTVTLRPIPEASSTFTGWSGDCSGTGSCVVRVDSDKNVTATFRPGVRATVTTNRGRGTGRVTSSPAGIDCPGACDATWPPDTRVVLSAIADPGSNSTFRSWDLGPAFSMCRDGAPTCELAGNAWFVVDAIFDLFPMPLLVQREGAGTGRVWSAPPGIDCGLDCGEPVPAGLSVDLFAEPAAGSSFVGWSGDCLGLGLCRVTMTAARTVTATFGQLYSLAVVKTGTGTGLVSSAGGAISCGTACSSWNSPGASVTLSAFPDNGSAFAGWGGACSGFGPCTVTMSASRLVTASFVLGASHTLSVRTVGFGTGSVSSTPAGISCGVDCGPQAFAEGTVVTLSAQAALGSQFVGWTGACTGLGPCVVVMNAPTSVTATFALGTNPVLSVFKAGGGSGTVSSVPAGISCGSDCSEGYPSGTLVTLTAQADAGSQFMGWSGACGSLGVCQVTMTAPSSVTATFAPPTTYLLQVGATGSGTVTSSDGRISYPSDCCEDYSPGSSVTLFAFPSAGYTFSGWSGACSGLGACSVTMSGPRSVTANFSASPPPTQVLSVGVSGGGLVTGSPSGISCPGDCSEPYPHGTGVSLSAVASSGWFFGGWSGACAGSGGCFVSMTSPQVVQASFIRQSFLLTVSKAGAAAASGLVTGSGIHCGTDCRQFYESGTTLTLLAPQQIGVNFAGWGGDCAFAGQAPTCTLTMNGTRNVTAVFTFGPF